MEGAVMTKTKLVKILVIFEAILVICLILVALNG